MYSIRRRLLLALAAGFAVVIVGTTLYVQNRLDAQVTGEFDDALLSKTRVMASLTEAEGGNIVLDYEDEFIEFEREERPDYFQFWLDDGTVLVRSSRLRGDLPRAPGLSTKPVVRDVELPDGRAGRAAQIAFTPRAEDPEEDDGSTMESEGARGLILVVAHGRERLDALLGRMRLTILGFGGIATLLAGALVWRVLASGLRPIDAIAIQVEGLDADSLDTRIGLARTPRELAPIVDQLNALLARLQASFERERRFAGNVAHELRTPIAELRSLAEVGARWPDDPVAVARFLDDVGEIAGHMERLVADLLLLARCHAGVERVERSPARLRSIVEASWEKLAARASSKGLRFRLEMPDDLVVESDPGKLEIILANLLGNAVSYTPENGEIRCVATTRGSQFRLDTVNPAAPLSQKDIEKLAEPFWRKDEARSSTEHVGLGLPLVSALAALLRFDLDFDQDADGIFRVRLGGPLRSPA